MTPPSCATPLAWEDLLAYWLGELDADREDRIELHYLGCEACTERLRQLAALAEGVRVLVRESAISAVVEDQFVRTLREQGLRVREYRVPCNGSVNCTVAPEDDIVAGRLEAPLQGISRVDLMFLYGPDQPSERIEDVPFAADTGAVVLITRIQELRALPRSTLRVRLLSVGPSGDRIVGEYTFKHTPHSGSEEV